MKLFRFFALLPILTAAQAVPTSSPSSSLPISAPSSTQTPPLQTTPHRGPVNKRFGLQLDVGASTFFGDLTDDTLVPAYDLQLKFLYLQSDTRPLYAYLSVNALWTNVISTGEHFIHDAGAKVQILSFLYVVNVCWNPHYQRLHACFGLGEGTVNTNSEGNRQDLGTWNYHGQLQYDITPRASVMLSAKFIGRLEQQVDFVDSEYSFASIMFGPQYVF